MSITSFVFNAAGNVYLSSKSRISVFIIAAAGALSTIAVIFLIFHMIYVALSVTSSRLDGKIPSERIFLKTRVGLYVFCLMLCGLLGGLASLMESVWAVDRAISKGPTCNIQGVLIQLTDVGTAVFTTLIAFHTFITLVLRKRLPTPVVVSTILIGWGIAFSLALLGPFYFPNFYQVVGLWCWISTAHPYAQLFMHYLPMFLSALIVLILYSIVFFSLRGHVIVEDDLSFTVRRSRIGLTTEDERRYMTILSRRMLWYPVVYIALITPISVCRMMNLAGVQAPDAVWVFAVICLSLMGFANAIVYATTRNVGRFSLRISSSSSQDSGSRKGALSRDFSIKSFSAVGNYDYDREEKGSGYAHRPGSRTWDLPYVTRPGLDNVPSGSASRPGTPRSGQSRFYIAPPPPTMAHGFVHSKVQSGVFTSLPRSRNGSRDGSERSSVQSMASVYSQATARYAQSQSISNQPPPPLPIPRLHQNKLGLGGVGGDMDTGFISGPLIFRSMNTKPAGVMIDDVDPSRYPSPYPSSPRAQSPGLPPSPRPLNINTRKDSLPEPSAEIPLLLRPRTPAGAQTKGIARNESLISLYAVQPASGSSGLGSSDASGGRALPPLPPMPREEYTQEISYIPPTEQQAGYRTVNVGIAKQPRSLAGGEFVMVTGGNGMRREPSISSLATASSKATSTSSVSRKPLPRFL